MKLPVLPCFMLTTGSILLFQSPHCRNLFPAITDFSSYLETIHSELQAELKIAQQTAKRKYDKHCAPALSFKPGDLVMLSWHNIKTTSPSNKLDYWKLGPFKIIESIGTNAYHLSLPPLLGCLHLVFNINLLKPYIPPSIFPFCVEGTSSPPDVQLEGENILNIKEFLDVWKVGHHFNYLVDFKGRDLLECAWVLLLDIVMVHTWTMPKKMSVNSDITSPMPPCLSTGIWFTFWCISNLFSFVFFVSCSCVQQT